MIAVFLGGFMTLTGMLACFSNSSVVIWRFVFFPFRFLLMSCMTGGSGKAANLGLLPTAGSIAFWMITVANIFYFK